MKRTTRPFRLLILALTGAFLLGSTACAEQSGTTAQAVQDPRMPTLESVLGVEINEPMPSWSLQTLDGKSLSSEDLRGKVVVLDVWATWCAPCVYEIPGYVDLHKKYADQGLVIVGISVDRAGPAVVQRFLQRFGVQYPVGMATPELLSSFIKTNDFPIPITLLIDREGILRHGKLGPMEHADYEKLVKQHL
jgi:thiol-disulfide isomerase/thioredoxin